MLIRMRIRMVSVLSKLKSINGGHGFLRLFLGSFFKPLNLKRNIDYAFILSICRNIYNMHLLLPTCCGIFVSLECN
jgi:hypothetical protein